ncbi:uncharacterized protein LOC131294725 [Anopheles ziemanni]|uniref:uncharacterized protein LOC131294725 n=1 Tax=Anopheles ziemanni TaxID=345580 RepID=UPI00265DEEDB|nr:uncharacterized protein LOC131294725 [Anopheles ziemanni]
MDGGNATGRTYVSMSMAPTNMPPPLTSIPTTSGAGGSAAGGSRIVMKPMPQQQTSQQSAVLRRRFSTNDKLTVVAMRKPAPPMITISSTAPPLASFSSASNSSIRASLPPPPASLASSPSGSVVLSRNNKTIVQHPTTGRNPIHPKPTTVGSSISQPKVEIAKIDALPPAPPVQEIVIGRKEVMYPNAITQEEFQQHQHQQAQNMGRYNPMQTKIGTSYTVQYGSTDIMSSHQQAKIGHTTIVKQNLAAIPSSHIIPVGQSGQHIAGTTTSTTTAVLLPIQQSPLAIPQHLPTGAGGIPVFTRLGPNPALKPFRPMVQSSAVTATSLPPTLTPPCPQGLATKQPVLGHPQPISSAPGIVSSVHQHVLPFGTTIKVTATSFEHQQQQHQVLTPVTVAGGSSVIVSKAEQLQQPSPSCQSPIVQPLVVQQSVITNAGNKPLQTVKAASVASLNRTSVVTPTGPLASSSIPPLYVPAANTKSTVIVGNSLQTTTLGQHPVADKRVLTTASGGQTQKRIIVTTAPNNSNVIQQLKQHRSITNKPFNLPPVPKLAPFLTTELQPPPRLAPAVVESTMMNAGSESPPMLVEATSTTASEEAETMLQQHEAGYNSGAEQIEEEALKEEVEMLEERIREEEETSAQLDEQEEEEEHQDDGIEMLDSSFDTNGGNEPQSTTSTPEKEDSGMAVHMDASRLEVTPKKTPADVGARAVVPNGSQISPRLQKRSLSELQRREGVNVRKRSESVHVRLSSVHGEVVFEPFKNMSMATKLPFTKVAADEERKIKRSPLKDATNEPASEDSNANGGTPKGESVLMEQEKNEPTAVAAPQQQQDNILLLCDEKFDVVASSVMAGLGEMQPVLPTQRRTSRRLDSIRRGLAVPETDANPTIQLDLDELAAIGLGFGDPERGGSDENVSLARQQRRQTAKMDENNIDFATRVRSNSTSSESSMAVKQFGGRKSLPESVGPSGGAAAKKGSKKSTSAGQSRPARQASIRTSIAGGEPVSESSFSVADDKDSTAGGPGGSDISTVSDHLRWHDGIGYLDDSRLHFEFNEFGMVQPMTVGQYERHCRTDVYASLTLPIKQRPKMKPIPGGRKRTAKAPDFRYSYHCLQCLSRGSAAEFATPEYCSIECVKKSGKVAVYKYILHSTHALQNSAAQLALLKAEQGKKKEKHDDVPPAKKKVKREEKLASEMTTAAAVKQRTVTPSTTTTTTTNNTSDEDSQSSLSLNSNAFIGRQHFLPLPTTSSPVAACDDLVGPARTTSTADDQQPPAVTDDPSMIDADAGDFNWEKYLQQINAVAAPAELFGRHAYPSTQNKFRPGMKLEAIDPENCSLFCVCTVAEVRGYRIKLHFDGYPADYDFWVNADSPDIFPPGWCRSTNRVLQPPSDYTASGSEVFRWKDYLLQTGATVPDRRWFQHINKTCVKNKFEIGMVLEADDLKKSGKVCVATVADKMGDRILVHFDGWNERHDYWVSIQSPYIHPVDWHIENTEKITPPPDWHKPFSWERYLRYKRHRNPDKQRSIVAASKELFQTRPPIAFQPGQRLEVVDRKQQIRIRPATVVAIDGYELSVCFDGWPQSYAVWIEDDSPNIHPVNWCARTRHPLEPPPNFVNEAEVCDGTCEIRFCMGRGNAKFPNKKYHDRQVECPYKRSNWMSEFRKTLRISHNQVQKHITELFAGCVYGSVDQHSSNNAQAKAKGATTSASQARSESPRPGKQQPDETTNNPPVKRSSSGPSAGNDGVVPLSKRVKQEAADPSDLMPHGRPVAMKKGSSKDAASRSGGPSTKESTKVKDSTSTTTSSAPAAGFTPPETNLRIALPVLEGYGPRLLHAYEVWRRNSYFLDECTERENGGGVSRLKNPLHWTTDETARYIQQLPGCDECATKIRLEEITGKTLLSFTQDDLVKYMGVKIGPAIKVYNRIIHLRQIVTNKFLQLS